MGVSPLISGSPPRLRGEGIAHVSKVCDSGITPAPAGRSGMPSIIGTIIGDHPRACGEKMDYSPRSRPRPGSPPRLRGEVHTDKNIRMACRITPAPAGRRIPHFCRISAIRDHPRACGEKKAGQPRPHHGRGSPPRLRGEGPGDHHRAVRPGITPAPAGRSPVPGLFLNLLQDHPRACGEKSLGRHSAIAGYRSPPRLRGEEAADRLRLAAGRITPAPAGRSQYRS